MTRVQVLLTPEEKAAFRRMAKREGLSLSAWLRRAGVERLEKAQARTKIRTVEQLREFFSKCDSQEGGHEPDWDRHLEVMRRSRASGDSGT